MNTKDTAAGWRWLACQMAKGMARNVADAATAQDLQRIGQALANADEWRRQFEIAMAEAANTPDELGAAPTPTTPHIVRKALERAERKLGAYVGVCDGDKELTGTVLPMVRAALALVDQPPPAEKVVGWAVMSLHHERRLSSSYAWETPEMARGRWAGHTIVRLVEEPNQ